jgi:DNA-binding MarR family transcriptional regulator
MLTGMSGSIARQSAELRMSVFRLARRLRLERTVEDLSDSQFGVLAVLNRFGPHTLSMLADRERVSPPSMNRTVNSLESRGYLRREPHETDRRRSDIVLTDAGAEVVRETIAKRDAWLTSRLRGLTAEERAALSAATEILERLASE